MAIAVINLGLKSLRCIVFSNDGAKLTYAARPVHTTLRARSVEQDANEWLRILDDVLHECNSVVDASLVEAIAVTASASCLVPTDEGGNAIGPVMMVSDSRCTDEAVQVGNTFYKATGVRKKIGTDLMLPKIVWFNRHCPEAAKRVRWYLSPADFLLFHLSNEVVTDAYSASKYLFDFADGRYPSWLEHDLDIPARSLPDVELPGAVIGSISPRFRRVFGFKPSCRVVLATYDALCAVLGSGVASEGPGAIVSGTVTSVRTLAPPDTPPPARGVYSSPWLERGLRLIGGSNNFGGGLIEWYKQAFFYDGTQSPYADMDRDAATIGPGAEGMLFLPYLLGERAPIWDPDVRATFFGIDRRHTRAHFTRAVFESVAFSARDILDHIQATGAEVTEIRFSGGLCRLPMVCQILADVLQREVHLLEEFETTAVGALILCLWGMGGYRSLKDGANELVRTRRSLQPNPEVAELYTELFHLYQRLYRDLDESTLLRRQIMEEFSGTLDSTPQARENL